MAAAIMEIFQVQQGALTQGKKTAWTLAFAAIAIIFNPIMPLKMEREEWAWFNVFGAGAFGAMGVNWGRFFSFLKDGPEILKGENEQRKLDDKKIELKADQSRIIFGTMVLFFGVGVMTIGALGSGYWFSESGGGLAILLGMLFSCVGYGIILTKSTEQ